MIPRNTHLVRQKMTPRAVRASFERDTRAVLAQAVNALGVFPGRFSPPAEAVPGLRISAEDWSENPNSLEEICAIPSVQAWIRRTLESTPMEWRLAFQETSRLLAEVLDCFGHDTNIVRDLRLHTRKEYLLFAGQLGQLMSSDVGVEKVPQPNASSSATMPAPVFLSALD
jgi:hypothetical protein